jgi:hypothetical protein
MSEIYKQAMIDGVASVSSHNGIIRIVGFQLDAAGKQVPSVELLVPPGAVGSLLEALEKVTRNVGVASTTSSAVVRVAGSTSSASSTNARTTSGMTGATARPTAGAGSTDARPTGGMSGMDMRTST